MASSTLASAPNVINISSPYGTGLQQSTGLQQPVPFLNNVNSSYNYSAPIQIAPTPSNTVYGTNTVPGTNTVYGTNTVPGTSTSTIPIIPIGSNSASNYLSVGPSTSTVRVSPAAPTVTIPAAAPVAPMPSPVAPINLQQEYTTRQPVTFHSEQPGYIERQTTSRVVTPPGSPVVPVPVHQVTTRQPVTFHSEQPGVVEQRTTSKVMTGQTASPVPVTAAEPDPNYWTTPEGCHINRQPYRCPIWIFVALVVLLAIINIWAIFRAPRVDNSGREITVGTIWLAAIIGVAFHLIFSFFFGWWIFQQCKACDGVSHHVIFLLAVAVPVILGVLTGVIIGSVMNVGFLWTASRAPNPEECDLNC